MLRVIQGHVHMLPFNVLNVVSEHVDEQVIAPVDIAIFVQGGYKIAVEVNGPQHYCRVLPPRPFQPPLRSKDVPAWMRDGPRSPGSKVNGHTGHPSLLGSDAVQAIH